MSTTRLPLGLSKNRATLLIIGAAIVLFIILVAMRPDAQVETGVEPVFTVRTTTVEPAPRSPQLRLYGTVVAPGRAALTGAVSADVLAVHKLPGDHATRGELLIELDPAEAEIAVAQAQASLQQAESQLSQDKARRRSDEKVLVNERNLLELTERAVTRAVQLRNEGVLSESELDAAKRNLQQQKLAVEQRELAVRQADAVTRSLQAALRSAEAQLQRAELDLARTRIQAPFDAAILATHVAVGDRVNPGKLLIELYDTSRIEIQAQIPNRYLSALRRAMGHQDATRAVAVHHGESYPARFVRLASRGGSGGQDAYFQLVGGNLPVDTKLTVELQLPEEADAVALPYDAIYDLSRIFVVRDGRLQSLEIEKLGDYAAQDDSRSQYLLVRSAELQAGDRVVTSQLPNAMTGLKVQAIES